MKKILAFLIVSSAILFACKSTDTKKNAANNYEEKSKTVEADLYFNWLRIGNFYNMQDTTIINISKQLENQRNNQTDEDTSLLTLFRVLKANNVLYHPYIEVVMENDVHATWYLNTADYDSIKQFKLKDLDANNQKLHISADVKNIYENAFICIKIEEIKLLDKGDYNNSDKKFNAKDYK